MKKLILLFLVVFSGMYASTALIEDSKARNAAMTLNYLHGSLNKIVLYNDKVVLEEEYNNIINNLNLTVIDDEELVEVITYLMDTLTQFRLSEMDRAQFRKEYEEKLEAALTDSLSGLANIRGSNPVELGINAVLNIGSAYFNYKKAQEGFKRGLEKSNYSLDKKAITDLNTIRKEFILTYWEIMKRYNMPDNWRVSEKQFSRLINILKDTDGEKKYRQLLRMKDELSVLPMYWYELSLVARSLNKKVDELKYIAKFEKLDNKLFRENTMYSLLLANKVSYLNVKTDKKLIRNLLEKIYKVDSLNPNRKLYSAMKYIQIGDYEKADFLLTQNIDDHFIPSVSGRLKVDLYLKTNDKKFEKTITELLKKQNLSSGEYLYYLAKRPTKLLIKEINKEIKKIKIDLSKSVYGKEDLVVKLPKSWVLKDIENTEVNLIVKGKSHKFNKIKLKDEFIEYRFKDVINIKDLIKNKFEMISLKFNHKTVPVELVYEMSIKSKEKKNSSQETLKEVKKEDSYLNKFKSKVNETIDVVKNSEVTEYVVSPVSGAVKNVNSFIRADINFLPIKVFTENKCFRINAKMAECK